MDLCQLWSQRSNFQCKLVDALEAMTARMNCRIFGDSTLSLSVISKSRDSAVDCLQQTLRPSAYTSSNSGTLKLPWLSVRMRPSSDVKPRACSDLAFIICTGLGSTIGLLDSASWGTAKRVEVIIPLRGTAADKSPRMDVCSNVGMAARF